MSRQTKDKLCDCPHHDDCIMSKEKDGKVKCECLIDTDFDGQDCPFYKKKEQR